MRSRTEGSTTKNPPLIRPSLAAGFSTKAVMLSPWASTAPKRAGETTVVMVTLAPWRPDRKSTRLNSSHSSISYAVFCLKKKNNEEESQLQQEKEQAQEKKKIRKKKK